MITTSSDASCGSSSTSSGNTNAQFVPQVGIPGSDFQAGKAFNVSSNTSTIANYVKAIYKYLIGIIGIVACIMLMVGGIVWLTAGGSPEKVKQAQEYIIASLTGLVLALGSFMILGTINPALVNFNISQIKSVSPVTDNSLLNSLSYCCVPNDNGNSNCKSAISDSATPDQKPCDSGYSAQSGKCSDVAQCNSVYTQCCVYPSTTNIQSCTMFKSSDTGYVGTLVNNTCSKINSCAGKIY